MIIETNQVGLIMREIKFRGKDKYTGKWVYGSPVRNHIPGTMTIVNYMSDHDIVSWIVYDDTVGQFTGLKDNNETEIYEGDVIERQNSLFVIIFESGLFGYRNNHRELIQLGCASPFEIIGNIHENPELLEGD